MCVCVSQGERESRPPSWTRYGTARHGITVLPPWPGLVPKGDTRRGATPNIEQRRGQSFPRERQAEERDTGGTGGGREGCTGGNRQGDDDRARKGNREQRRVMDTDGEANLDGV